MTAAGTVVAGAVAITVTHSWPGTWPGDAAVVHDVARAQAAAPGPFVDSSDAPEESSLLFSSRTWRTYGGTKTSGFVELFRLADGTTVLRLAGLPAPRRAGEEVWVSPETYDSPDFRSGAVRLGTFRTEGGRASYVFPTGVSVRRFASVVVADAHLTPLSAAPLR